MCYQLWIYAESLHKLALQNQRWHCTNVGFCFVFSSQNLLNSKQFLKSVWSWKMKLQPVFWDLLDQNRSLNDWQLSPVYMLVGVCRLFHTFDTTFCYPSNAILRKRLKVDFQTYLARSLEGAADVWVPWFQVPHPLKHQQQEFIRAKHPMREQPKK